MAKATAESLSIEELREALAEKEQRRQELEQRRDSLAEELQEVEQELAELTGGTPVRPGKKATTRRRKGAKSAKKTKRTRKAAAKPDRPLVEYIKDVLRDARQPMRAKAIEQAVLDRGYTTASKDFYGIVAATLRDPKQFERVSRGVYKLKEDSDGQ